MNVKKIIIVEILLILLFSSFSVDMVSSQSHERINLTNGRTLYVGGNGPNNYTKIQDAINDAFPGDTIFVYDDSSPYYENIVINKSIALIGENRETTIIETDKFPTIWVESEEVIISNFFISNLNASAVYIDTWSENTTISNNIIFVEDSSHPAVCLLSNHNLVFNNSLINGGILGGSYPNLVFNLTLPF